jgi:hypothetical protein
MTHLKKSAIQWIMWENYCFHNSSNSQNSIHPFIIYIECNKKHCKSDKKSLLLLFYSFCFNKIMLQMNLIYLSITKQGKLSIHHPSVFIILWAIIMRSILYVLMMACVVAILSVVFEQGHDINIVCVFFFNWNTWMNTVNKDTWLNQSAKMRYRKFVFTDFDSFIYDLLFLIVWFLMHLRRTHLEKK